MILAGDLNVAKEDIDIYETKGHDKTAGFTKEEKDSFSSFWKWDIQTLLGIYTPMNKKFFFSKRGNLKEQNKGWRLDYFIINENLKNIKESDMLDKNKYDSSDHIPIFLTFKCK